MTCRHELARPSPFTVIALAAISWLASGCGSSSGVATDPSGSGPAVEIGALDASLSKAVRADVRHAEVLNRPCWRHEARYAAIPDSLELASRYDPDVPDRRPGIGQMSRPSLASIGRSDFDGTLVVDVLVDTFGQAAMVCIEQGSSRDLNALVAESAFKSQFIPGRKGGVAVPVWMRVPYRFGR